MVRLCCEIENSLVTQRMVGMNEPNFLKAIIRGSVKVSLIIVFSSIGLALSGVALYKGYLYIQDVSDRDLYVMKKYERDLTDTLGASFAVSTKYSNDSVLYKVAVTGFPRYIEKPENQDRGFQLIFLDSDGFQIETVSLIFGEATRWIDPELRVPKGLLFENKINLDPTEYRRIAKVNVSWNFDVDESKSKRKDKTGAL